MAGFDITSYRTFFYRLTGSAPYRYQEELAALLFRGESVVLRAPTGSGKTWAVLGPFLYSRFALCDIVPSLDFDRAIYALPLRSLASGLHRTALSTVQARFADSFTSVDGKGKDRHYEAGNALHIALQMGGQQDDPFFEADIVFTTIDQLLSAYLFAPVSVPQRVGNIAAGALIGSLLILDEVHLLDPNTSLATSVEMLDRLANLSQFVLMSATLPDSVLQWLGAKLKVNVLSLSADEVQGLPSHSTKTRKFDWISRPLNADDVVKRHRERTIAIVNSVSRAQTLFSEVHHQLKEIRLKPHVLLLHSRFYPEDRCKIESELSRFFGPDASSSNVILISTQVIEAGMDISADVLLTELAPLNSLIQRAGRVARYPHRNTGDFVVFDLPINGRGETRLGPYRGQSEAVRATRQLVFSKQTGLLDYPTELEWLNNMHGGPDVARLSHLESLYVHRTLVLRAIDGLDESACARLVRDISSVNVIISDHPESVSFERRRWPELLSIHRASLF